MPMIKQNVADRIKRDFWAEKNNTLEFFHVWKNNEIMLKSNRCPVTLKNNTNNWHMSKKQEICNGKLSSHCRKSL